MLEEYHQILEVNQGASLEEMKRAYRKKAKLLHPDKNASPQAHQEFIFLTEAYECLITLQAGHSKHFEHTFQDWSATERETTRRKAAHYAQMDYTEFVDSAFYRQVGSFITVTEHLAVLYAVAILLVLPITATTMLGAEGLVGSLVIILVTLPITVNILKTVSSLSAGLFWQSLKEVVKTKVFHYVALTILNIFILFKIGFQTLITLPMLGTVFFMAIGFSLIATKLILTSKFRKGWLLASVSLSPLAINLLLLGNYLFSDHPSVESYGFEHQLERTKRGWQKTSSIILEDNQYGDYPGLRTFFDFERMQNSNHITYTFEDGLFGIRVMKKYEFKRQTASR